MQGIVCEPVKRRVETQNDGKGHRRNGYEEK
jgi:hypothetical protein